MPSSADPASTGAAPTVEQLLDPDELQKRALLQAFLATVQHFFGGFPKLFQSVTDPRNPVYITYPLAVLMTTGVLMFVCRLGARRQITQLLRHNGPLAAKFQALFESVAEFRLASPAGWLNLKVVSFGAKMRYQPQSLAHRRPHGYYTAVHPIRPSPLSAPAALLVQRASLRDVTAAGGRSFAPPPPGPP